MADISKQQLHALLDALGFDGDSASPERAKVVNGSHLAVDFANKRIIYDGRIVRESETTANFSQAENLVILECVHRLLEKGYQPQDITLEKQFKLGKAAKGRADILVRRRASEKSLMIIECKTPGGEFQKEQERMQDDGGQLFSYFQQDKTASVLVLYTSGVDAGQCRYQTQIVRTSDSPDDKRQQMENEDEPLTYEKAKNINDSLAVWKKRDKRQFHDNGVFEGEVEPYNPGFQPLKIRDLKEFAEGDRGKLHGKFMEILRHNNISDRSNAFNRFISLVLAKMADETKPDDAIADFQFKLGIDDADSLYERLQTLYTGAMQNYLKETIVNHTLRDIRTLIENFPRQTAQDDLYRIYRELKLYANNEFAFKEVYNEKLYKENALVLEEVVTLFQGYRFKYDEKSQFLGDFFELMLEDGYKQTEGQFFTPTPVARFVVSSLPLEDVIRRKLRGKTPQKLPLIADFACGSGHFLTESIAALQDILEGSSISGHKDIAQYKKHTRWARDVIWGMERDYRLARTSQVACFMHGDGDANIIFGDGLEKHPLRQLPEGKFDALVANPPYSIKDFKKHLNVPPKDFELWDAVGLDSDDIEVFFIERMAQLLAVGGYAGIVLPSTIFANPGIYDKARELLMRYFEIRAVVQLGENAFSATNVRTIVLFLRRRDWRFAKNCRYIAETMIMDGSKRKGDFVNSRKLYRDFLQTRGVNVGDEEVENAAGHLPLLQQSPLYGDYRQWVENSRDYKTMKMSRAYLDDNAEGQKRRERDIFADKVLRAECEKFYRFLLTYRAEKPVGKTQKVDDFARHWSPQNVCIVKNDGDKTQQRKFLGYKFSKMKGHQGLHESSGLLCDKDAKAADPDKVNYYVRSALLGKYPAPSSAVAEHCAAVHLCDLLIFDRVNFHGDINVNAAQASPIGNRWDMSRLGDFCDFQNGLWEGKKPPFRKVRVLRNTEFQPGGYLDYDKAREISVEEKALSVRTLTSGDILLEKSGGGPGQPIGRVALFNAASGGYSFGNFIARIRPEKDIADSRYLWNYLHLFYLEGGTKPLERGVRIMNLDMDGYKAIQIPLPPMDVQRKIAGECDAIDRAADNARQEKARLQATMAVKIPADNNWKVVRLGDVIVPQFGTRITKKVNTGSKYPVYGGGGESFRTDDYNREGEWVVSRFAMSEHCVRFVQGKFFLLDSGFTLSVADDRTDVDKQFLGYLLSSMQGDIYDLSRGSAQRNLDMGRFSNLQISLPSLDAQRRIVDELDAASRRIAILDAEIDAAQGRKSAVLKKYL